GRAGELLGAGRLGSRQGEFGHVINQQRFITGVLDSNVEAAFQWLYKRKTQLVDITHAWAGVVQLALQNIIFDDRSDEFLYCLLGVWANGRGRGIDGISQHYDGRLARSGPWP